MHYLVIIPVITIYVHILMSYLFPPRFSRQKNLGDRVSKRRLRPEMTEIVDRGIVFKSWKKYAKALAAEVKCLQQFCTPDRVTLGYIAFLKEAEG